MVYDNESWFNCTKNWEAIGEDVKKTQGEIEQDSSSDSDEGFIEEGYLAEVLGRNGPSGTLR